MKTKILLFAILIFSIKGYTQTWQWTHPEANPDIYSNNYAHDVEVDSSGNAYVLGNYWDSLYLGGNFITKGYGSYLAKYNAAGTLLWYKLITANPSTAGSYPDIFASDMVVNANGIFITGRYVPTSYYYYDCNTGVYSGTYLHYQIGDFNFTSSYNELGFFLTRFNSNGSVVWNKLGTCNNVCLGVAAVGAFNTTTNITSDKNGNIIASFLLGSGDQSSIAIGGDNIPIQSGYVMSQLVVVKYTSGGVFKMSAHTSYSSTPQVSGTSYQQVTDCNSIIADNNGNIFLYGTANDSTYFGSKLFRTSLPPSEDGYYFPATFIAKLSSAGVWQFAKELCNGSSNTLGSNIGNNTGNPDLLAVDGSNNVYALVNASNTTAPQIILGDTTGHTKYGSNFLVKMTNNGSLLWDKFFGVEVSTYGQSLSYLNNSLYINGSIGSSNMLSYSFSDLYTQFYSIYSYGYFQSFVAKTDLNGNFQWVTGVGGNNNVSGFGIKTYQDNIYTCGTYNYDITTLGNLNGTNPTAATSIFFGKLKDQYIRVGAVTPTELIPGCTISVPFTSYGLNFSSKNKFFAELSDANGDFTNTTTIGNVKSKNSGTITATIPASLSYGSGYRIRIRSSDTLATGYNYYAYADTGYALTLTCPAPSSGLTESNITATSATLNWDIVDCASGYRLQYRVKGSNAWITAVTTTNNIIDSFNLTGLASNTTYQWRIKTRCKNNGILSYSAYTSSQQFKTTSGLSFNNAGKMINDNNSLKIMLLPNPATTNAVFIFNAKKPGKYMLELMDVSGKLLKKITGESIAGENSITIDVSRYPRGMYLVVLTNDEHGRKAVKLYKE